MDCYSRRIVGWSMRPDLEAELVVDALEMVLAQREQATERRHPPALVRHEHTKGSQNRRVVHALDTQ